MSQKSKIIFAQCILLIITLFSFYPTFKNGWTTWDDDVYVLDNPAVQQFTSQNIKEVFFTAYNGSYLPLTIVSYMVDYSIDGFNPTVFHTSNLLFHLCNTLLVFWFIFLLSEDVIAAFITALLFGIHPMRVESVAWIAARKDVLSMFFFLLSIISYVRFVKKEQKIFLSATFILFACALFSKVIVVTLPLILLLIDHFLNRKQSKEIIIEKIPFAAIALAFSIIGYFGQKFVKAIRPSVHIFDSFVVSLHGITFYIEKFFFPFNLSSLYPYPGKVNGLLPPEFYGYAVVCIVMLIIVWYLRENKSLLFGTLFFLISLFPVLQFIRFSKIFAADRFTYFAYIGLFFVIGHFVSTIWRKQHQFLKLSILLSLFVIIGGLSILTFQRTKVWENNKTLWNNVFLQFPNALKN